MSKVIIFDTSILCCWLQVPGKTTCGPIDDQWDKGRIDSKLKEEELNHSTFVLPLATIIETGNHIAQARGERFFLARSLSELILKATDATEPWAAFSQQAELWTENNLRRVANEWPQFAAQGLGIGDITIKEVAEYYAKTRITTVEILTGDQGLKVYEPMTPIVQPRRRR
ncbi:hypothetical protein [Candidatus Entotheonella palauensis]|uniref:PIN domain-containing protein n=1 Tax=Candidatus Entotheonella gemina TaxID=1429439 RepID=W4MFH6_9BACT|nr:hypothetical protein [Candidatus Entotheonella palauensis]ETX09094.1 MAG: hypothetical protein ETSY2_01525 [Candidatus Entotheonella gemina]